MVSLQEEIGGQVSDAAGGHGVCGIRTCVCVQVDDVSFWTLGDHDLSEMGITNAQDRSKIVTLISSRGKYPGGRGSWEGLTTLRLLIVGRASSSLVGVV